MLVAGVDKANFIRWAMGFVDEVKDLTAGGRKVLLIYDGCRSHMSVKVLQFLKCGGVEVYVLPAHTSALTQPLDVCLFSPFKSKLTDLLASTSSTVTSQ